MTEEDILQALKLTAMGRFGHDLQRELAAKLAAVFAKPAADPMAGLGVVSVMARLPDAIATTALPDPTQDPMQFVQAVAKRGPGRPKKAE